MRSAAALALGILALAGPAAAQYACEKEWIEVMFEDDTRVRLRDRVLVDLGRSAGLGGVEAVLAPLGEVEWHRLCDVPEARLDELQSVGEARIGKPVYNLNGIYRLRIPAGHDPWALARSLESLPGVRSARPVPLPPPAPFPPPDYTANQGYARPASSTPVGIDADYAQTFAGGDGTGVTVCDLEYSWNYSHGDVTKLVGSQINANVADPFNDTNHGTAVAGELVADANAYGVTGLVPGAAMLTCGTYYGATPVWNVPGALAVAAANLSAGDVILLEQQWDYTGSGGFIPIEWWTNYSPGAQTANAVWVAIWNAVANGIHVVEAGGNGNVDTDNLSWFWGAPYDSYSGAIIVGAGGAYTGGPWPQGDLERLGFSSYGSRFDLQGWGEDVMTTGYGVIYSADGPNWYYTNAFSGTSSASPIVAAAVASSVGYWKGQGRSAWTLTAQDLRNYLAWTGTAQANPGTGLIGPRPDLARAFDILHTEWVESPAGPVSDPGDGWGFAWVDYDGDGDPDLHLPKPAGSPNKLLRNDGGWNFADVAAGPVLDADAWSGESAWADYDDDGDPDFFVTNGTGPSRLVRNDGNDAFADVTPSFLQKRTHVGAWADYDLDGDLDLYTVDTNDSRLARNDGNDTFANVTTGLLWGNFWTTGCSWVDWDGDGDLDLYQTSIQANTMLRNDGGTFVDVTAPPLDDPDNTVGVAWGDYDNDGDLDAYLACNGFPNTNNLLCNDGVGVFVDVTPPALADTLFYPKAGYSPSWADSDNDGDLDLFLSNAGHVNRFWQNDGAGGFVDMAPAIMAGTGGVSTDSRGAAWADFYIVGDLDLYMSHAALNSLFRNDNTHGNHWLHLDLEGTSSNHDGVGAVVEVTAGGVARMRAVSGGGGSHAQESRRVEFGLGQAASVDRIVVRWPSGTVDSVDASSRALLPIDEVIAWREGTGIVATAVEPIVAAGGPSFRLHPNAPNPFAAETTIRFEAPGATPVKLRVFDVAGRAVRTLVDGITPGGTAHRVRWDGRNDHGEAVAAGVYFYRLEVGDFRESRRLVRLR